MPERADFLNAIRAEPDEDAPRLIYADWLDDHGESLRADFIRFGVAAGEGWSVKTVTKLAARFGLPPGQSMEFRRGFLEPICLDAAAPIDWLPQILETEPGFHYSTIFGRQAEPRGMADALAYARRLDLILTPNSHRRIRLTRQFACRELTVLNDQRLPDDLSFPELRSLYAIRVAPVQTQTLLDAAPNLTALRISPDLVTPSSWPFFSSVRWPESLAEIDGCLSYSVAEAITLIRSGRLPNLERMSLSLGGLEGLDVLDRWPQNVAVPHLTLGNGAQIAVSALIARGVRSLQIHTSMVPAGAPLADPDSWPALRKLTVWHSGLDSAPLASGVEEYHIHAMYGDVFSGEAWHRPSRLRRLVVSAIVPELVPRLVDLPALAGLESLDLDANSHPPSTVTAIARAPFARNLRALVLRRYNRNKKLDEAAVRHFGPRCDVYWQLEGG